MGNPRLLSMPDLDFDDYGLLPGGTHDCTMEVVESLLTWNDRRRQLTTLLQEFIANELSILFEKIPPLVLDGSYVTQKEEPRDINLILELRDLPDQQKMNAFDLCQKCPDIFLRYQIDMKTSLYESGEDYVTFFSKLRTREAIAMGLFHDHRKGLLRLL
jgi:hypothetical protein